jgi:hypothetical protein
LADLIEGHLKYYEEERNIKTEQENLQTAETCLLAFVLLWVILHRYIA